MNEPARLTAYILKQKKKILLGLAATITMAAADALTGAFFKVLTDSLSKLVKKISSVPISELKIPLKLKLPLPFLKEKITVLDYRFTGYESIIVMLVILCLVFLVFSLFYNISRYLREVFMSHAMFKILQQFKEEIYAKITRLPKSFYDKNMTGDIISRVTFDVSMLGEILNVLIEFSRAFIYVIILVPIMFYINWKITLFAILFFPVSFMIVNRFLDKIRKVSKSITDNVGDYTAFMEEKINAHTVIKSFNTEKKELSKFNSLVDYNFRKNYKNVKLIQILRPSNEFIADAGLALIILYFGISLLTQQTSLGNIVFYLYLVKAAYKPVKKIAMASGQFQVALISIRKIFRLFDEQEERELTGNDRTEEFTQSMPVTSVKLDKVSFSYTDETPVLTDTSFEAEKGRIIVLTGRSGCGKTTLLNLIPRYYNPASGSVLINGIDTGSVMLPELRSHIAMVHQDKFLFSDTVETNLFYGTDRNKIPDSLPSDIKKWADFFIDIKDSDTGRKGRELSAGQKQKLDIIRSLIKDTPILLMDEPTSDLDFEACNEFVGALPLISKDRIVIIATHDEEIIKIADKEVKLEAGVGIGG